MDSTAVSTAQGVIDRLLNGDFAIGGSIVLVVWSSIMLFIWRATKPRSDIAELQDAISSAIRADHEERISQRNLITQSLLDIREQVSLLSKEGSLDTKQKFTVLHTKIDELSSQMRSLLRGARNDADLSFGVSLIGVFFDKELKEVAEWVADRWANTRVLDAKGSQDKRVLTEWHEHFAHMSEKARSWTTQWTVEGRECEQWFVGGGIEQFYRYIETDLYGKQLLAEMNEYELDKERDLDDYLDSKPRVLMAALREWVSGDVFLKSYLDRRAEYIKERNDADTGRQDSVRSSREV